MIECHEFEPIPHPPTSFSGKMKKLGGDGRVLTMPSYVWRAQDRNERDQIVSYACHAELLSLAMLALALL